MVLKNNPHEMHLKNLCLIQKKLTLMNSEIDNDLKFDDDDNPPPPPPPPAAAANLLFSIKPITNRESNEISTPESLLELVSDDDAKEEVRIELKEKEENDSDIKG
jgi:hypothetical protein